MTRADDTKAAAANKAPVASKAPAADTTARRTAALVWKSISISVGILLLLLGLACLVLPGPGVLLILAGLALLSPHSRWAHRLMQWVKSLPQRWRPERDGADP